MPEPNHLRYTASLAIGGGLDVSADVREIQTARGASDMRLVVAPGSLSLSLNNLEGHYSHRGSASRLGTDRLPGVAATVTAQEQTPEGANVGDPIPIFLGYIIQAAASSGPNETPSFTVRALDALDALRFGQVSSPVLQGLRADQLVNEVLDLADWPASTRDVGMASPKAGTVDHFFVDATAPDAALREAAKCDPGSHLWVKADGDVAFRGSREWHLATSQGTLATPAYIKRVVDTVRREDVYNEVVHTGGGSVQGAAAVVFADIPGQRTLPPGETLLTFPLERPVLNLVEPAAITNYRAVRAGGDADRTNRITLTTWRPRAKSFDIGFTNDSDEVLTLLGPGEAQGFTVSGTPLVAPVESRVARATFGSPVNTDQVWQETWDHFSDVVQLERYAKYRAHVFSNYQERLDLEVDLNDPETGALNAWPLRLDYGDKVDVRDTVGPYASGINETMVVVHVNVKAGAPRGRTTVRLLLLSEDLALASGHVIGRDQGTGKRLAW